MKLVIAITTIVFLILLATGASAYTDLGSGIAECYTCEDCTKALSNDGFTIIRLGNSLDTNGNCIWWEKNSKTLNCRGYSLSGAGDRGAGIYLYNKDNNTIKNCNVKNFVIGISLMYSSGNHIEKNNLTSNAIGVRVNYDSDYNTLTGNNASSNGVGMQLWSSTGNNLTSNLAGNNQDYGAMLGQNTNSNTLDYNKFCDNGKHDVYEMGKNSGDNNFCLKTMNWNDTGTGGCTSACITECTCNSCSDCMNKLSNQSCNLVKLTTNITNKVGHCIDNPTGFKNKIFDCQGNIIDGDDIGYHYGIYINNKNGNTIKNCVVTDFADGIRVWYANYTKIINNTAISTGINNCSWGCGLSVTGGDYCLMDSNNASGNCCGLVFQMQNHSNLTNNEVGYNNVIGISLFSLDNCMVAGNIADYNGFGPASEIFGGIAVDTTFNTIFTQNSFSHNNIKGIGFQQWNDTNNNFTKNNISYNNGTGIFMGRGWDLNNFFVENSIIYNSGDGIFLNTTAKNNTLLKNTICNNGGTQIVNLDVNTGDNNTCDNSTNWNDTGTTGCTYACPPGFSDISIGLPELNEEPTYTEIPEEEYIRIDKR
ncbi:MAG: NosD domain-containing protein [archaeon]